VCGSDLGGCQGATRVREAHTPPSVAAQTHANNSTDNSDSDTCCRNAHKLTAANEQKVARLGLTHNEKSHRRPGRSALGCRCVKKALGFRLWAFGRNSVNCEPDQGSRLWALGVALGFGLQRCELRTISRSRLQAFGSNRVNCEQTATRQL
jgi:hypothetical protein